jgi:biopolymer transport protein ExbD
MRGRRRRGLPHREELIITSLVDIALCLVLGFMVSMPAFIESGIFVTSPSVSRGGAESAAAAPADDIKVNIYLSDPTPDSPDGRIFLNEEAVTRDYLIKTLPQLLARSADRKVIIGTDFNVVYGRVVRVLDWAKQAGAGQLCLLRRARA